ncbi:hypothetical protein [Methyloceanibacter caenitepidi]|uniref:SAM-dependent methyltransferase n=1 Tax=Methyloceanibacter caenitepidi TaxID=1384459 RepID=A0A0A8K4M6_9HYPH|nr:hypothetical protein [Methyloceanibacter caenitepidi]BAQ16949.1 hypothetical protein GL4_1493 [Methyloceanibacter caenitepidi]
MAQRKSGYKPMKWDRYFTPEAAPAALLSAYDFGHVDAWNEPCAGSGHICAALEKMGCGPVFASDIAPLPDASVWTGDIIKSCALKTALPVLPLEGKRVVTVTNLPYGFQFRTALEILPHLIAQCYPTGAVAALFPIGFDTRESRRHLFRDNEAFCARVVLTFRLRWTNVEQKPAGPSSAHQWLVWDWLQAGKGLPCDVYRSEEDAVAMLERGLIGSPRTPGRRAA